MSHIKAIAVFAFCVLSACAGPAPIRMEKAVGPRDTVSAAELMQQGNLIVYSATDTNRTIDASHQPHSDYEIYSNDGKLLRKVTNRTGSFDQDPVVVRLPAGRYTVSARAVNVGKVIVPVVIAAGRVTPVDLNSELKTDSVATAQGEVRLPNGHVIGAHAD